jgi:hypothetical protein
MDLETKQLLDKCRIEIGQLRQTNQTLSAQMYIVDVFAKALGFNINSSSMCVDICWEIERHIEGYMSKPTTNVVQEDNIPF